MLNEYLEEAELQSSLEEFLKGYNFLFSQLDPERKISIFRDKPLLAKLHHSLNLDKYSQKSFREKLLIGAPDDQIIRFAEQIGVSHATYADTQTEYFRSKLAAFKWGNNDVTREFVNVFGYPDYLVPGSDDDVISSQDIIPSDDPFNQLRDYQSQVAFKAIEIVKNPNAKFLIHMPTGSGKTRVAMEVVSHFLNERTGRRAVWLADRRELCEQAMDAFIMVWSHLGKHPLKIYRIWGGSDIPKSIDGTAFVVAMYQKIGGAATNSISADLIIPDEAHISIAPTYRDTIDRLRDRRARQTRVMGLTATPGRGSNVIEENMELSGFFHNTIIGIEDEGGTIESLQKKGVLARCQREILSTEIPYTLTRDDWEKLSKDYVREFPDGLLETIANDEKRNLIIIRKLRDMSGQYKRILVFCGGIKQSKLMSSFMDASGYPSAYIDGTSPAGYRRDVVTKFRNGNIQFLFNYNVFTAGFDMPQIDAVVIARPTTSVVLYGQMIGRGMRGTAMGGTAAFTLVDVVDNIITEYGGLEKVHEYFTEYWE